MNALGFVRTIRNGETARKLSMRIDAVDRILQKKKEIAIMYCAVRDLKIVRGALLLLPISYVPLIARLSITQRAKSNKSYFIFQVDRYFLREFWTSPCRSHHARDEICMCQKVVTSETRQTMYFGSLRNLFTYRRKETSAIRNRKQVTHYIFINAQLTFIF